MKSRIFTRKSLLAAASAAAVALLSAPVWAAAEMVPAERWPLVSLGLAILLAGIALASAFTSIYELSPVGKLRRAVGVFIATLGAFLVVFAVIEAPPAPGGLGWSYQYEASQTRAAEEDKIMMVDFTADWCAACHELEAEVFHHERVRGRLLNEIVLVKVDFDARTEINERLSKRFEVTGLPTVVFVSPEGEFLRSPSFEGKIGVDEFLDRIDQAQSGEVRSSEGEFERVLREEGWLAVLLLVFVAGIMSSLTPCVYPLIPITVSIFGARGAESRMEAFGLSVVYVLGIVVTYSVLGVLAASLGWVFGGAMQSAWVVGAIALLFFVLGFASLGLIPFRLPGDLQTKLSQRQGTGIAGAFGMGLVAGVIAAPCVGPIVAGILVYVAQQQDPVLGLALLSTFAWGMGLLFILLGTFSSLIRKIPRSGGWMEGIKVLFAIVFFAMGLYYARFFVPDLAVWTRDLWLLVGT